MVTGYSFPDFDEVSTVADLHSGFEWQIPSTYNIADACLDWPAEENSRTGLYHVDESGVSHEFTYGELAAAAGQLAAILSESGVSKGDRVAVCVPQSPESLVLHLALYRLGAVAVPLSVLLGGETFTHVVETSGADAIWLDEVSADRFETQLESVDARTTVFELGTDGYAGDVRALGGLTEQTEAQMSEPIVETEPDDPALFVTTSGTSGSPKCVVQSHQYLIGTLPGYQLWYELFGDDHSESVWTPASWSWAGALFDVVFPTLAMGGTVCSKVRRRGFDPEAALKYVERAEVTRAFLPPTGLRKIQRGTDPTQYALDSLEVVLCGGEFLAGELKEWGQDALEVTINVAYGLTEANALIGHCEAVYPDRGESIGVPYPGHDISIVDEEGDELPADHTGEIALRPPDPVLFEGYWVDGNLEEVPTQRLFYTGDRGYRDEDGYIYYEGRSDEVIISSGYRIDPRELERVLETDAVVQEAIVGGVDDDDVGERIVVYVVPADGHGEGIAQERLTRLVRERLGKYKTPHEIHELTNPPRTHSEKINRSELFER